MEEELLEIKDDVAVPTMEAELVFRLKLEYRNLV